MTIDLIDLCGSGRRQRGLNRVNNASNLKIIVEANSRRIHFRQLVDCLQGLQDGDLLH
jgi:hypothetical protein